MDMANYILSILKTQITVMLSWGVSDFRALPKNEGLIFHTSGFKHDGWVKVVYSEADDAFNIFYMNNSMETLMVQNEIYVDVLVNTIDEAVEKTKDYDKDIRHSIMDLLK